jgi:hypothetical protein
MATVQPPRHFIAMPQTRLGKRALRWAGGAIVVLALLGGLGAAGLSGWWLGVPGLVAGGCIVAAGGFGLAAIAKYGERSILVFAVALLGLYGVVLAVGEVVSPH